MLACKNSDFKFTDNETEQFLSQITQNAQVSITDITEIKKQPTNNFGIITRYPLAKSEIDEYHKNGGTIVNKEDNIENYMIYQIKKYELKNENNEMIDFINDGKSHSFQSLPLAEYDGVLYKNLGAYFTLSKKFEHLKGYLIVVFEMLNGDKKEVKLNVNISVYDKVPE